MTEQTPMKEEKRLQEEKENANKPQTTKKRKRGKRVPIEANTPAEAVEKILKQKKISLKINYDVLKNLDPENMIGNVEEENAPDKIAKKVRVRPIQQTKANQLQIPERIKKTMFELVQSHNRRQNAQPEAEEENETPSKIQKLQPSEFSEVVNSAVVVGSSLPELLDISADPEEDEELYEEKQPEEEDDLLQQFRGGEDEDEEEDCEYQDCYDD